MLPLEADDPRVIGEFRLYGRLGAGGMGRVYLASSPGGRAVAVKVIHAHLARDAEFRDRFRREVSAAQAVNGAYTTPVVAAGPDDDPPWLATAYVAGPSLQEAVAETGPLTEDAVLKLAAGLGEALRAIHDGGVVHRDLKPANVLLAEDGPRLIDFGIARALDGTLLTSPGSVLGTPSFMSPEQAQGQPTGPASDVFSLGAVVCFAATGARPFGLGAPPLVLYRIVHTEPDLTGLPPKVRDLVAACLAKEPALRPTPARLAASLMGALPPGDSPPAFWPAPVAQLIADHQAQFAAGLIAGESSAAAVPAPASQAPAGPGTPSPTAAGTGLPGQTQPLPGLGRRRALAALAGMATAGLVVAGWELTRPGPAVVAKSAAAIADQAAQRRISSSPQGTTIWTFDTNAAVDSVVVHGGVVYAGTKERAVYALDALTGRLLWRHLMKKGTTRFLAVATGAVLAADGYNGVEPVPAIGGVYALDSATGKLRWEVQDLFSNGLAVTGETVYVTAAVRDYLTTGVTALSVGAGELLWTFDCPTNDDIALGVTAADGAVYTTTEHGEIFALSASTGETLWQLADPAITFTSVPQVTSGVLYASTGHDKQDNSNPVLYAVGAKTGRLLWQHPLGSALRAFCATDEASVIFTAAIRYLVPSRPGATLLSAVNAVNGQQLWQVPVASEIYALTPDHGKNLLYTGSANGVLDAWQADTGNHLWSYRAGGAINSEVLVQGGAAYFGCTNQRVYAVAAPS